LAEIAAAASTGNQDAVAIISSRIRKFGATREDIQSAIDWTPLHAGSQAPWMAAGSYPAGARAQTDW
jgi:hypothetical protein